MEVSPEPPELEALPPAVPDPEELDEEHPGLVEEPGDARRLVVRLPELGPPFRPESRYCTPSSLSGSLTLGSVSLGPTTDGSGLGWDPQSTGTPVSERSPLLVGTPLPPTLGDIVFL